MSTRPDINSFKLIGTTEDMDGDLLFIGVDDPRSTSIKFTVRSFPGQSGIRCLWEEIKTKYNLLLYCKNQAEHKR